MFVLFFKCCFAVIYNSFGASAVAGNTAAGNIESFVYTAMNSFYQTALTFVGQNYGAGKLKRIKKISFQCIGLVTLFGVSLGSAALMLGPSLLKVYGASAEEIEFGLIRLGVICSTYFLCGIMDTLVGIMRGLGYAILPMFVSLTGACLLRVVWVMTVFQAYRSLKVLYISYPVTWIVTASAHLICLIIVYKKTVKAHSEVI